MRSMKRHAARLVAMLGLALLAYGATDEHWRASLVPIGTALLIAAYKVDNALKDPDPGPETEG